MSLPGILRLGSQTSESKRTHVLSVETLTKYFKTLVFFIGYVIVNIRSIKNAVLRY